MLYDQNCIREMTCWKNVSRGNIITFNNIVSSVGLEKLVWLLQHILEKTIVCIYKYLRMVKMNCFFKIAVKDLLTGRTFQY